MSYSLPPPTRWERIRWQIEHLTLAADRACARFRIEDVLAVIGIAIGAAFIGWLLGGAVA